MVMITANIPSEKAARRSLVMALVTRFFALLNRRNRYSHRQTHRAHHVKTRLAEDESRLALTVRRIFSKKLQVMLDEVGSMHC